MRALQIMGPGRAEVVEVPQPEPGPREVRVKVTLCNTCPQWDLHLANGEPMFVGATLDYPYTVGQPGHEMTGVVDALGSEVPEFAIGQTVAAWRDQGHHRQGCYAEYVLVDADNLLPVPDGLAPEQVASLELAMCVSVCLEDLLPMNAIPGRRAAVNGLGPAGLVAAQLLRAEGAVSVIGFEPNAGRRELAVRHGIVDEAFDPAAPETAERIPLRGQGAAFDVAIDCCGLPGPVRWVMDRCGKHLALFAVQRHDYTFSPSHYTLILVGYGGHRKSAAEYALWQIANGRLDLRPLCSTQLPFERYLEGVDLLRSQSAVKIGYRP